MCRHQPPCPPATAADWDAAHVVTTHPEQGWSLLCNGAVLFEDTGALLPDGRALAPRSWPQRPIRHRSPVRPDRPVRHRQLRAA
jgi:hypothetical protein